MERLQSTGRHRGHTPRIRRAAGGPSTPGPKPRSAGAAAWGNSRQGGRTADVKGPNWKCARTATGPPELPKPKGASAAHDARPERRKDAPPTKRQDWLRKAAGHTTGCAWALRIGRTATPARSRITARAKIHFFCQYPVMSGKFHRDRHAPAYPIRRETFPSERNAASRCAATARIARLKEHYCGMKM